MAPALKFTAFVAILLCLQSISAADILSPFLSPILDDMCKEIECGKGKCKASLDYTFGFICECEVGWKQSLLDGQDRLRFLPCVIPNCTLDSSCSKVEPPAAPVIKEPPHNESFFDPCRWTYCGQGSCVTMNKLGHRCECEEGHDNLLNVTAFPCFKECSLGMDCARLGLAVSNNSNSPTNLAGDKSASSNLRRNFLCLTILMISLTMVPWK